MANETNAKFGFKIAGDSSEAKEAANTVEALTEKIRELEESLKEEAGALRRVKGQTDEAKAAREQLKAKINAERDAISAANLALLKQGTSYDKVVNTQKKAALAADNLKKKQDELKKKLEAASSKKLEEQTKSMGSAIGAAGGPASILKEKLGMLSEMFGTSGAGMGALTLGAAALGTAILALAATFVAGTIKLSTWIIATANAARTANLFREAASGSASNAYALGTQIDALALKVPTARAALNDLAISLAKSGLQGQTLVDTLNAVGQANAALGDDVGSKLREFVERGRLTQRFQINPFEMMHGTGVQFDDVAKALAANLKVGVNDAKKALFEGRVKLGDGAAALRKAVEDKFGKTNKSLMLDLNVQAQKFKETLSRLVDGVSIEPLLNAFKSFTDLFSESTFTGVALKQMLTTFGNTLGPMFKALTPLAAAFFKGMIIAALDITIAFFQVKKALASTFGDSKLLKNVDGISAAVTAGKIALYGFGIVMLMTAGFVAAAAAPFVILGTIIATAVAAIVFAAKSIYKGFEEGYNAIASIDWGKLGTSMVEGLVNGLTKSEETLKRAVHALADKAKEAFKAKLGIASPSKVFAEYGKNTTAGYAKGVEQSSGDANAAVSSMVSVPTMTPKALGGGGVTVNGPLVSIEVSVSGGGEEAAAAVKTQLDDPSFTARLAKAVEEALIGAGVPVAA